MAAATLERAGRRRPRFDLVLANIQRDVLETLAAGLRGALAPGGWLVLSGLLTADAAPVLAAYQQAGPAADRADRRGRVGVAAAAAMR